MVFPVHVPQHGPVPEQVDELEDGAGLPVVRHCCLSNRLFNFLGYKRKVTARQRLIFYNLRTLVYIAIVDKLAVKTFWVNARQTHNVKCLQSTVNVYQQSY